MRGPHINPEPMLRPRAQPAFAWSHASAMKRRHLYGLMSCCCPSLLTNFKEALVPLAPIATCVGSASPPRATTEPSSVAAIFTLGRPCELIR